MEPDILLNAYLDLNLLLIAGTVIWCGIRRVLRRSKLATAYLPQLRLLNGLTVLLAMTPLMILAFTTWIVAHPPNLSDMLVSQYLQGNVSLSASQLETLLGLRESLVRDLLAQRAIWAQTVFWICIAGFLLCLLHLVISVARLRRSLSGTFLWKKLGRVELRVSDTARVAFSTRGLRTLYVVLPQALLSNPRDLKLTISHELQHFRQRDIECEFLLEMLRPLLFWNPAFYVWRREIRILREYACDQALTSRRNFDVRGYCECLIRACHAAAQERVLVARRSPAVALVDRRETRHRSTLSRRILAATATPPTEQQKRGWAMVSGLLVGSVLITAMLIQRPSDWSQDRLMLSTIVNLERLATRNSQPVSAFQSGFVTASQ
jgi:beta-lactamase regulating signal transducer with metallopeptidase domain